MFEVIGDDHEHLVSEVLASRRSVRRFSHIRPESWKIEKILDAGIIAPFLSVDGQVDYDFKKFIVIVGGTKRSKIVSESMKAGIRDYIEKLEKNDPYSSWLPHLRKCAKMGSPDVFLAPYTIIVAEKNGLPPFTSKSISHCLQNMWIQATAMKLGCQVMSELYVLGNCDDFCNQIGIASDFYELDGLVVGYPAEFYSPPNVCYPPKHESRIWIGET